MVRFGSARPFFLATPREAGMHAHRQACAAVDFSDLAAVNKGSSGGEEKKTRGKFSSNNTTSGSPSRVASFRVILSCGLLPPFPPSPVLPSFLPSFVTSCLHRVTLPGLMAVSAAVLQGKGSRDMIGFQRPGARRRGDRRAT